MLHNLLTFSVTGKCVNVVSPTPRSHEIRRTNPLEPAEDIASMMIDRYKKKLRE